MTRRLPDEPSGWLFAAIFALWISIIVVAWTIVALSVNKAHAEEHIHVHPTEIITGPTAKCYETWMRPDAPTSSCCSEKDCYATPARLENGRIKALHRETGEWIEIPAEKVEVNRDSPDGRNHLCAASWGFVFCFVWGGGS